MLVLTLPKEKSMSRTCLMKQWINDSSWKRNQSIWFSRFKHVFMPGYSPCPVWRVIFPLQDQRPWRKLAFLWYFHRKSFFPFYHMILNLYNSGEKKVQGTQDEETPMAWEKNYKNYFLTSVKQMPIDYNFLFLPKSFLLIRRM